MARSSGSSPSLFSSLIHLLLSLAPLFFLSTSEEMTSKDVSLQSPVVQFVLSPHAGYSCERVRVSGISRLHLKHYSSSLHVMLKAFDGIPEKLHGKIEVCSHRNVSMGQCQCDNGEWKTLHKGQWSLIMSPYEKRYIDVKINDKLDSPVTVIVEEEFQQWRLICLGFGLLLLILAPIVSTWVPFYVCSSMAVGVLAVVLLLTFQLMKLLPMGRKNVLYITLYGSVLGVGSYIAHYFSTVVNSILVGFGLSEEMHYPVSVMLLVLTILAGGALGYWIVRKYVISEDGRIDAGIAQFVRWALNIFGVVFVLQSSVDVLLPVTALGTYWCIYFLSKKWRGRARLHLEKRTLGQPRRQTPNIWQPRTTQAPNIWQSRTREASASKRAEFLSRSPNNDFRGVWKSPSSPHGQDNTRTAAVQSYSSPRQRSAVQRGDYYSSFHGTPVQRFSRKEWKDFTRESTAEALAEWASSPEVTTWLVDNAHRVRLDPDPDRTSDDSLSDNSSGSSDETMVENGSQRGLLNWY